MLSDALADKGQPCLCPGSRICVVEPHRASCTSPLRERRHLDFQATAHEICHPAVFKFGQTQISYWRTISKWEGHRPTAQRYL